MWNINCLASSCLLKDAAYPLVSFLLVRAYAYFLALSAFSLGIALSLRLISSFGIEKLSFFLFSGLFSDEVRPILFRKLLKITLGLPLKLLLKVFITQVLTKSIKNML